jgi:hypothetical protein
MTINNKFISLKGENIMLNETMKLIDEIEELKKGFIAKTGADMLEEVDESQFMMIKKLFNVLKLSEDVMKSQAEILENMDKKLDKLLSKIED